MQKVAQAWLIVTLTGSSSAFYLGLDSFAGEVPILLFTLIGGVVADRRDRRHMMLISQVIQMTVAFILAALVFTELIQIWMVRDAVVHLRLRRRRLAGRRISR